MTVARHFHGEAGCDSRRIQPGPYSELGQEGDAVRRNGVNARIPCTFAGQVGRHSRSHQRNAQATAAHCERKARTHQTGANDDDVEFLPAHARNLTEKREVSREPVRSLTTVARRRHNFFLYHSRTRREVAL